MSTTQETFYARYTGPTIPKAEHGVKGIAWFAEGTEHGTYFCPGFDTPVREYTALVHESNVQPVSP
jgi:hypothetical protein